MEVHARRLLPSAVPWISEDHLLCVGRNDGISICILELGFLSSMVMNVRLPTCICQTWPHFCFHLVLNAEPMFTQTIHNTVTGVITKSAEGVLSMSLTGLAHSLSLVAGAWTAEVGRRCRFAAGSLPTAHLVQPGGHTVLWLGMSTGGHHRGGRRRVLCGSGLGWHQMSVVSTPPLWMFSQNLIIWNTWPKMFHFSMHL